MRPLRRLPLPSLATPVEVPDRSTLFTQQNAQPRGDTPEIARDLYIKRALVISRQGTRQKFVEVTSASCSTVLDPREGLLYHTDPQYSDLNAWQSSEYVGIAGSAPRTLLARVKRDSGGGGVNFFSYGAQSSGALFEVTDYFGTLCVHMWGGGYFTSAGDSPTWPDDVWNDIAIVYDGYIYIHIYLNGAYVQTGTLGGALNTTDSPLYIGGSPAYWPRAFTGDLAYVAIVDKQLSGAKIGALARSPWNNLFEPKRRSSLFVPGVIAQEAPSAQVVQYLRPISDSSNAGGWKRSTDDSTSNLYTVLDETVADDDDFIYSPWNPSTAVCKLKLTSGSGLMHVGTALRYRYASEVDGGDMIVRLVQGASTVIASATHSSIAGFNDGVLVLSTEEREAISDPTDLYVEFEAS